MKLFKYYRFLMIVVFLLSCSEEKGDYFYPSLGYGEPKVAVLSNSTGILALALYDLDGNFLRVLHNFNRSGFLPRGLDQLDARTLVVSTDSPDQIMTIDLVTLEARTIITSSFLNGNIYQTRSYGERLFIAESNNIEMFDGLSRIPNAGSAAFIPTSLTTASETCTISAARGLSITSSGVLAVASTNQLSLYDVTGASAKCIKGHGITSARAVTSHTNGNFYVASFTGDAIYEVPSNGSGSPNEIFNDTTVIDGPSALVAMPDGSLLVASSVTRTLEKIDVLGNRLDTEPFIKDAYTNAVADLLIVEGY